MSMKFTKWENVICRWQTLAEWWLYIESYIGMLIFREMMWTFGSPRWSLDLAEDRWILLYCSLALIELSGIFRDVVDLQLIQFSLFTLIILDFTSVNKFVGILAHMITQWGFPDFLASRFGSFSGSSSLWLSSGVSAWRHGDIPVYAPSFLVLLLRIMIEGGDVSLFLIYNL